MAKKKTKIPKGVVIVAILAVTGLEIAAMAKGMNGKMFATALALIGALAGLSLPQINFK